MENLEKNSYKYPQQNFKKDTKKNYSSFKKTLLFIFFIPVALYLVVYVRDYVGAIMYGRSFDFSFIATSFDKTFFNETSSDKTSFNKTSYLNQGYPESLAELAEKNPETIDFVNNYPNYHGDPDDIDISDEVTKGTIPHFLQWDERWGYEMYGNDFLAVTGCGPTSLAMVYCGLTGQTDQNPYTIAMAAQDAGFYIEGSGSSWNIMDTFASTLGLTVHSVTFDAEHIKSTLENEQPIICIMGPGDFTTTGHFIVLTGVDDSGLITVNDPNSNANTKKHWDIDTLMSQIRNLWSYSYDA